MKLYRMSVSHGTRTRTRAVVLGVITIRAMDAVRSAERFAYPMAGKPRHVGSRRLGADATCLTDAALLR